MRKFFVAALAALALPTGAHAAAFINGDFESGVSTGGGFVTLGNGSTGVTGWIVGGNSIDYIGSYWQAASGNRSIDLSGNGPGSIAQTFDTIIGQRYLVTFALAGNPDNGPVTKTLLTTASGNATQSDIFTVAPGTLRSNLGWQTFRYIFTATGGSTTLTFASGTQTAFGPALDNVTVSAIPEAATWAMMIAGMGLSGAALRRRRATALA